MFIGQFVGWQKCVFLGFVDGCFSTLNLLNNLSISLRKCTKPAVLFYIRYFRRRFLCVYDGNRLNFQIPQQQLQYIFKGNDKVFLFQFEKLYGKSFIQIESILFLSFVVSMTILIASLTTRKTHSQNTK